MVSTATAVPEVEFRIRSAEYFRSGPDLKALGMPVGPEIAFIGRSNVGKSSLLNALLQRRSLVRVSRTPGQTRLVNLFKCQVARIEHGVEVTRDVVFADLPGYGFAKTSKGEMLRLTDVLSVYLQGREALRASCQLFDCRHAASAQDHEVFRELAKMPARQLLVATKGDKIVLSKQKAAVKELAKPFGISPDGFTLFSAPNGMGRNALWQRMWDSLS